MKVRVTLKDPDTMADAVTDAMKKLPKPEGISASEWDQIRDAQEDAIRNAIIDKWMEHGEYLTIDFEVNDEHEAVSATVVPN